MMLESKKFVLALDISSTATGWALFEYEEKTKTDHPWSYSSGTSSLKSFGTLEREEKTKDNYPWSYVDAANEMARKILQQLIDNDCWPSVIVIEETNQGKNRYTQKLLEWVHYAFLSSLKNRYAEQTPKIEYVSTSAWHKALGVAKTKADRDANKKLSQLKSAKAKRLGCKARDPQARLTMAEKAEAGLTGKVTTKDLSIRYVEAKFPQLGKFKKKQNNEADAICIGLAHFFGAPLSNPD